MTKQEKIQSLIKSARLVIRNQNYRLRCLIKDVDKRSKSSIEKAFEDVQMKANHALLSTSDFEHDPEKWSEYDQFKSLIHYRAAYHESFKKVIKMICDKSDDEPKKARIK
jgi:lipopolysaccharide biosynthesis glycosyltransferase